MSLDAVAVEAGVSKATIYRRWSSKEALMLDAWMTCVRKPEVPDTGTLQGDLEALLCGADTLLSGSVGSGRRNFSDPRKTAIREGRRPLRCGGRTKSGNPRGCCGLFNCGRR